MNMGQFVGIENWQGKQHIKKTCPAVTLSTANPTLPNLGSDYG
jgi:hypothetical protein